jgi:hypothetical protein
MAMKWRKLTAKRLPEVFERILKMSTREQEWIAAEFDGALNNLRDEDAFGTEGQLDPRGDPRS